MGHILKATAGTPSSSDPSPRGGSSSSENQGNKTPMRMALFLLIMTAAALAYYNIQGLQTPEWSKVKEEQGNNETSKAH